MTDNGIAIENARQRRERLHGAMCDLETAVSAPAQLATWVSDLSKRLEATHDALLEHIAEVEGADGIIAHIVKDSPRLHADAEILRRDHPVLRRQADQVLDLVRSTGPAPATAEIKNLRRAVLDLLGNLSRHRHLGADLVYEAYHFDIGGQA